MISPFHGAAFLRAVLRILAVAGLMLAAGCASYEQRPLDAEDFQRVLDARRPEASAITEAIGNSAWAPADGLSLEEAELLTLYLNPRLRAVREAANVPSASARYAGLWDDPEIGADALHILQNVEESWIFGASLSFTIPISGRLAVAKSAAEADARAALVGAWTEEQAVLRDLRETWADWKAASRSLEISRSLQRHLRELVTLTNRREELGELVTAEAVAFRLEEARLNVANAQLETDVIQSRLRVLAILGLLPDATVDFTPSEGHVASSDSLNVELVYERSPAVLLAAAEYEAAEERLRLEIRKQYPDITLGPLFENEEGMDRLGFGFSVPIPILNANRQGIAETDAARNAARADWELAVQESLSERAQAAAELNAGLHRLEALKTTVVPLARQQIEQARRLADLGEINTLLILEALQSEREAALDVIEAEAAVARSRARLQAVIPDSVPPFRVEDEEQRK